MNYWVLLDWAVPSAIGFMLGYLTCLLVGRAVQAADSPVPQVSRRGQLARTLFGVLLVILGVATFIDSQQANACFREAITARDGIATQQIEDQIALLTSQGETPAEQRVFLDQYVETLREQLRVRSDNPLVCR